MCVCVCMCVYTLFAVIPTTKAYIKQKLEENVSYKQDTNKKSFLQLSF